MSEIIINNNVNVNDINEWVFDVDDTLYSFDCGIDKQIKNNILSFLCGYFDIPENEAKKLQNHLYETYGTTVRGLMIEYESDPREFMEEVHSNIDYSEILPNPELRMLIKNLPGRKFTFSNGPRNHMFKILEKLEVLDAFDGFMATEDTYFIPKPEIQTFNELIKTYKILPQKSFIFEDSLRNLQYPFGIGFKTFWIRYPNSKHKNVIGIPEYCDIACDNINVALKSLEQLKKQEV